MAIKVTTEDLEKLGDDLKAYSDLIISQAKEMNSIVTGALSAWEGNAQKKFADRFDEIYPFDASAIFK